MKQTKGGSWLIIVLLDRIRDEIINNIDLRITDKGSAYKMHVATKY